MAYHNKISQKELDIIRSSNKTALELSCLLKRHKQTIYLIAKKHGIILKKSEHQSNAINNSYFKTWTKEMSYILGFIAADGCLLEGKRNGKSLEISLAKKDEQHLKKISMLMGYNKKLVFLEKTNAFRFSIGSREIFNDLVNIGITPRKSLTLKWPSSIPKDYVKDFIRGYFDGDGTNRIRIGYIDKSGSCIPQFEFSMLGTLDFLQGIKKTINDYYKEDFGCIEYQEVFNIYRLTFAGTKCAEKFGNFIYDKDMSLFLDRKFRKYKTWLKIKDNRYHPEQIKEIAHT